MLIYQWAGRLLGLLAAMQMGRTPSLETPLFDADDEST